MVKGAPLFIEGRLKTRSWEKDGVKHSTVEFHVNEIEFKGDRGGSSQGDPGGSQGGSQDGSQGGPSRQQDGEQMAEFEDDIPF